MELQSGDALIIVDVQNDFLPDGALAVPNSDVIITPINHAIQLFTNHSLPVIATRDWHPARHCSFTAEGGPWPPHCIADTKGALFADELHLPDKVTIVSKANMQNQDAYSGFQGTHLHHQIKSLDIKRLFIGGLATDYCVLNTTMDALKLGYQVMLLTDAIHAVNLHPLDGERAITEMTTAGAQLIDSVELT